MYVGYNDEKLEKHLENVKDYVNKINSFKDWFDSLDKIIKKDVVEKFENLVGRDWRSYALKTAKKIDLIDKVQMIYDRTIKDGYESLNKLEREKSRRLFERTKRENIKKTADEMHSILSDYLKKNSYEMSEREIGCLEFLINEGSISTREQLAEYGVV